MTLLGTSVKANTGETWAQGLTRMNAMIGPLRSVRTFNPAGIGTWDQHKPVLDIKARPLHSFKDWDPVAVKAYLTAAGPSDLCYFHEPEDNILGNPADSGAATFASYEANTVALCQAIIATGKVGVVTPATILMQWTLDPKSGRDVYKFLTPKVVAALKAAKGICGFDAYSGPDITRDPVAIYAAIARLATSLGLPWGIYETGIRLNGGTTEAQALAWYQKVMAFSRDPRAHGVDAAPAARLTLWNAMVVKDGVENEYRIDKMPKVIAFWKAEMAKPIVSAPATPPAPTEPVVDPALTKALADLKAAQTALTAAQTRITELEAKISRARAELT